jgi:hypothetical protein
MQGQLYACSLKEDYRILKKRLELFIHLIVNSLIKNGQTPHRPDPGPEGFVNKEENVIPIIWIKLSAR